MATIKDVAALADVSRMTVSRVINNNGYVGAETRERVEKAIKELNYKPNLLAKALVTKQNKIIAYVMVNISDPFHNLVKQGFESIAYHGRYTSMMCDVHSAERQRDYINMFQESRISGAVFHHLAITKKQVEELEKAGVRCVMLDNEYDIADVSSISTDNYAGAQMAAEHLYEKGHRRVACIHGYLEPGDKEEPILYEDSFQFKIWRQRTNGFTDGLAKFGIAPAMYFACDSRLDGAERASEKIVDEIMNQDEPVTAVYCENDIMAVAILKRLQEKNVRVPEDIAIMGHDGLDMVRILHPQITTIEQPRYEMGRLASQILIDDIENDAEPRQIMLKPKLSKGETT